MGPGRLGGDGPARPALRRDAGRRRQAGEQAGLSRRSNGRNRVGPLAAHLLPVAAARRRPSAGRVTARRPGYGKRDQPFARWRIRRHIRPLVNEETPSASAKTLLG
jgi:hypothetical protein